MFKNTQYAWEWIPGGCCQRALALELSAIGISFQRKFDMAIYYTNQKTGSGRVDFLVENKISVELKVLLGL